MPLKEINTTAYEAMNNSLISIIHYHGALISIAIIDKQIDLIAPDQLSKIKSSEENLLRNIEESLYKAFEEAKKDAAKH